MKHTNRNIWLNSPIDDLRDIEANTNDSLNGVLSHLGYSLEQVLNYECMKENVAFHVNGVENDNDNRGLQTLADAVAFYNELKETAKRKDLVSITTIGQ